MRSLRVNKSRSVGTGSSIPGLKVALPSNPYDARGLLAQAIRDDDPVIFCEHKALYNDSGNVPESEYLIPFGEAAITRSGTDITVVALARIKDG